MSPASRLSHQRDDDIIGLCRRLVTIDSADPPGREIEVAQTVHDFLLSNGVASDLDVFAPGRANVVGRLRGAGRRPALMFSSHMDTVPVGTQPWTEDPFSGRLEGGRLYGRGATDMKSALAAFCVAAARLAATGETLAGDLVLAFSAGESSNCLGARRFRRDGLMEDVGALLVGEPSSLDVIVAEKGQVSVRVSATGRIGHVSGDPGVNAILMMTSFLDRLDTLQFLYTPNPLLGIPTVRVGRIGGGSAVNVTPDHCVAEIDVRTLPGLDPETVIDRLTRLAGPHFLFEVFDYKPPVVRTEDDPFTRLCVAACEGRRGVPAAVTGVAYVSDASVLADGLDIKFAIVGPGELGLSCQPDEYVETAALEAAADIYVDIARRWFASAD